MSNNETTKALPATILAIHSEKDETNCRELLIVIEGPRPRSRTRTGPRALRHMKQSRLMLAIERARGKAQLSSARRRSWKNKPAGVLDESARWHVRRIRSQACQAAWSKARQTNLAVAGASDEPGRRHVRRPGRWRARRAWPSASCRTGQRHPPRTAWGRRCSTSAREPRHSP